MCGLGGGGGITQNVLVADTLHATSLTLIDQYGQCNMTIGHIAIAINCIFGVS